MVSMQKSESVTQLQELAHVNDTSTYCSEFVIIVSQIISFENWSSCSKFIVNLE